MPPIQDTPRTASTLPRPPEPRDANGVGVGLEGYSRAAPTHPHLGWTERQVNARTGGLGRPLAETLRHMDAYGVPSRGLHGLPAELFRDARVRIDHYINALDRLPARFTPAANAPASVWIEAAQQASEARNQVMTQVRGMISEKGLSTSVAAKAEAPSWAKVWNGAQARLQAADPAAWAAMDAPARDIATAQKIIQGAGKSDPTFNALVRGADEAGRGLKALRFGGRALVAVGAVTDAVSLGSEVRTSLKTGDWTNTGRESARVAGGWLGAAATGAAVGAAAGTIVPGLGNVAGFLVGAAAGAVGYWAGSQLGEAAFNAAAGS